MKVVVINGSPRRNGNSTTLALAVAEGAAAAGAERLPMVHLEGLRFAGCRNCGGCESTGECVLLDDLTDVYARLRAADIWVMATPIYFDSVSGQFKLFYDRLFCLTKRKMPGVRHGVLAIAYEADHMPNYLRNVKPFLDYLSWFGDFREKRAIEAWGMARLGDIHKRPDLLEQARALGRDLVEKSGSDANTAG